MWLYQISSYAKFCMSFRFLHILQFCKYDFKIEGLHSFVWKDIIYSCLFIPVSVTWIWKVQYYHLQYN